MKRERARLPKKEKKKARSSDLKKELEGREAPWEGERRGSSKEKLFSRRKLEKRGRKLPGPDCPKKRGPSALTLKFTLREVPALMKIHEFFGTHISQKKKKKTNGELLKEEGPANHLFRFGELLPQEG